jgi:hypothetical protein
MPTHLPHSLRIALKGHGLPWLALLAGVLAASLAMMPAARAQAGTMAIEESAFEPFTPWHQPPMALPAPTVVGYVALGQQGFEQADRWRSGSWYCEYLACTHGPYSLLTVWGEVPMFEAVDALELAQPSAAHRAMVNRFAHSSERFWNSYLGGYAPYPNDSGRGAEAWFDDNGWLGLAFLNAYKATHEHRFLEDAQRAFHFIATQGWDYAGGGGMWWNTEHPYHSGPALASDTLLGVLLYNEDHQASQLQDAKTYVDWANAQDTNDERKLYLEQSNQPLSVNDYVQAPLIFAQYLLCKDGQGEAYCVRAGRTAATLAETNVTKAGYRYNYGPEYDAIYLQWMMAYGQATGDPYWLKLAELSDAAASHDAADGAGLWLSSWWGGPIADPETHAGMFRTMAATTSLFAWTGFYASAQSTSGYGATPPPAP